MNKLERLQTAVLKAQEMRTAQKSYFKTRDRGDLALCKRLEAELDKAIDESLREDDMLDGAPVSPVLDEITVAQLDPKPEPGSLHRTVCDALPSVRGAIPIGGGSRRAKVRFNGFDWRIVEFLEVKHAG